jgi:hypothetical protein
MKLLPFNCLGGMDKGKRAEGFTGKRGFGIFRGKVKTITNLTLLGK